jgi:hypothetical protein
MNIKKKYPNLGIRENLSSKYTFNLKKTSFDRKTI